MDHTRHSNIFNIPTGFSVTLIGAGGIGATTALTLAKMGVQTMVVYDDDVVSDVNLTTQLHPIACEGLLKTASLGRVLGQFSDELTFMGHPERVGDLSSLRSTLIISAVDSIAARQAIWLALTDNDSAWKWFIDARMAAEEYQHFMVSSEDDRAALAYNKHLLGMDENSAPDLPCTAKATFFTAMLAAGHIGTQVRNIVRGEAKSHRLVHIIPDNWLETFNIA